MKSSVLAPISVVLSSSAKGILATPSPPDFATAISQWVQQFVAATTQLLVAVDGAVIDLSRIAYVTVVLLGVLLYFTRLEKRLGRDLIKGGVILAILAELVFPLLSRV